MNKKHRDFAFGAFNTNVHSEHSYFVFRQVLPQSQAPAEVSAWNAAQLKHLEKFRDIRQLFRNCCFKLADAGELHAALDHESRAATVVLGEPADDIRRVWKKLQLGSLTRAEAQARSREGVALPIQQACSTKSGGVAHTHFSDAFALSPGVIRGCALSIANHDDHTFSIVHVEHRAKVYGDHDVRIGELTLLFKPYHNATD